MSYVCVHKKTQWLYSMLHSLLPPANEVCEGNAFTHVCLSTGRGCILACLAGFQAHTQGGAWGIWPGGLSRSTPMGVSRPTPGKVSRPTPRGVVYPSMHWGRPPAWWLLLQAVCILLECILVSHVETVNTMENGYIKACNAFNAMYVEAVDSVCSIYTTLYKVYTTYRGLLPLQVRMAHIFKKPCVLRV